MGRPRREARPTRVRPDRHEKPLGRGAAPVPQTDTGGLAAICQGGRETLCQGTRQAGPVTSGEGAPPAVHPHAGEAEGGRSESAQPTVYQKHRSPLTRKGTYGG
jgi:hypothetical protein